MSMEMIAWWKKSERKKLVLYGLRGSHNAVVIWKKNEGIAKKIDSPTVSTHFE